MASPQETYLSAEHPNGSFVIAATSNQFNDRAHAINEAIVENFGKASAHLLPGAQAGIHFADVVTTEKNEPHYLFDDRLKFARPLAVNAMKQVIQHGLEIELSRPELVGQDIVVQALNSEQINGMRRLFGSIARIPEIEQPVTDSIGLIQVSSLISVGEGSRIDHFMKSGLMLQPIREPFSSLQLWEASTDPRKSAQIIDEVPFKTI